MIRHGPVFLLQVLPLPFYLNQCLSLPSVCLCLPQVSDGCQASV
eukprot:SAG22_NODE_1290_length_4852_cov_8.598780_5_plen_43_part_01